jgi:hypothetical protein
MGSSSGGDYKQPAAQPAPAGTVPYGQTSPYRPNFVSFLPSDNSMATGLTPAMIAQINASNGPAPAQPKGLPSAQDVAEVTQLRQQLAQAMQANRPTGPRTQAERAKAWRNRDSGGGYGSDSAGSYGGRGNTGMFGGGGLY